MEQAPAADEFRPAIRARARDILKDKWGTVAIVSLVYLVVGIVANGVLEGGGSLIVSGPMSFGLSLYFLSLVRGRQLELTALFDGWKQFVRTFLTHVVALIFIVLWTLLLVVPGIMKALSYAQIWYLLVDDPDLQPMDALKKSEAMMEGHRMELFMLGLSFIGWFVLAGLTCGIGLIWLIPYVSTTFALYYEQLKDEAGTVEQPDKIAAPGGDAEQDGAPQQ